MPQFFETIRNANYSTTLLVVVCLLGFVGGVALRLYLGNARTLRLNSHGKEQFNSIAHVYRVRVLEGALGYLGTGMILVGTFGALGLMARVMELW